MGTFTEKWSKTAKKRALAAGIVSILIIAGVFLIRDIASSEGGGNEIRIEDVLSLTSQRKQIGYDHVVIPNGQRTWGIAGAPAACWYDIESGDEHILPFLVKGDPGVKRVLDYTERDIPLEPTGGAGKGMFGPTRELALDLFDKSAGILFIGTSDTSYELGLNAGPMASYLNIPVIVVDEENDAGDIDKIARLLGSRYIILVGDTAIDIGRRCDVDRIELDSVDQIHEALFAVIENRFGRLDYGVITNPADTVEPSIIEVITDQETQVVDSLFLDTGSVDIDLIGSSTYTHSIDVPEGIVNLRVYVNFTEIEAHPLDPLKDSIGIDPLSFGTLRDGNGRLVASAPSFSKEVGKNYLETLIIENSGTYELELKVYYGVKGLSTMMGTSLGASRMSGSYSLETSAYLLDRPHLPLFEDMSIMATYMAAARGGFVLSDMDLELTSEDYAEKASGYGTGPWYERELLEVGREKVDDNVLKLQQVIDIASEHGLSEGYLNDKGWLAILGGGNMVPMYYEDKEASWMEDPVWGTGWATDLPYSLNLSLSVGRPIGRSPSDVSALIARTIFYEDYTEGFIRDLEGEYGSSGSWKDHFHFLAGEGGGRTGWLFHQREFSNTAQQHGFTSEVYMQDYENDRQTMVLQGAYERANYFEMILHGDWSWFSPELNGFDRYSTGVKVTDLDRDREDWELGPSVFNSGVCLLGRLGGLRPEQSITQAFFHSGINAFFCATRSTGSEAKAGPIEEALLFEDLSVGEAIRKDKRDNPQAPSYFVRTLYGDPAFDPYEPENGYGDQGLAKLKKE